MFNQYVERFMGILQRLGCDRTTVNGFDSLQSLCLAFCNLFLAVLGLHCCAVFSLVSASGGSSLVVVCGLLVTVASLVVEHWLQDEQLQFLGSLQRLQVVTTWLSCSTVCGIFLDQGLNPCLLHWQVDSLPLSHQGNAMYLFLMTYRWMINLC